MNRRKKWIGLVCCLAFWILGGARGACWDDPTGLDQEKLRAAIKRALPLIQSGAKGSAEQRQCFTCHHQAMPIFAIEQSRKMGLDVDLPCLQKQVTHTREHLARGLAGYREGKGQGGQVLTAGYALWALDVVGTPSDEITEAVAHYLIAVQGDQGRWHHHSGRPPTSDSDFTTSYVALRGLHYFGGMIDKDRVVKSQAEAASWLSNTKPIDTEDHVFRLGCSTYLPESETMVATAERELIALQREDGGWAQTEALASDPYATATATATLLVHGVGKERYLACRRGLLYLLSQQLEDGSWHVKTRAKGFQPYFESGFPHGKDQFISMAASAWSAYALGLGIEHWKGIEEAWIASGKGTMASKRIESGVGEGLRASDATFEEFMQKHAIPGASLALARDGKVVHSRSFGFADLDKTKPVDAQSRFRIASLSKPITAVGVLLLVDEGKLGFEEKIYDVLALDNHLREAWELEDHRFREITIRQLLQHRGGWDRDVSFDPMFHAREFAEKFGEPLPMDVWGFIRSMLRTKLDFEPGARYAYSNFGYCLLGRAIEARSGMAYGEFIKMRVLQPLGMLDTTLGSTERDKRHEREVEYFDSGKGVSLFDGRTVASPYGPWSLESMDAHGGWISTANDMARFAAHFGSENPSPLLSAATLEQMFACPIQARKSWIRLFIRWDGTTELMPVVASIIGTRVLFQGRPPS